MFLDDFLCIFRVNDLSNDFFILNYPVKYWIIMIIMTNICKLEIDLQEGSPRKIMKRLNYNYTFIFSLNV